MPKPRISAIINTRNESSNISDCLSSLRFCDEIIVVDMKSDDNTIDIAKQFTDKIYSHPNTDFVEPARNFALSKASGDWLFIVDADERVPKTLAHQLVEIAQKNSAEYVRIPRKNLIFGQWLQHSRWWPDHNIRFFKKGSVIWQNEIHSVPIASGLGITLDSDPNLALLHHHYRNIDEYLLRSLRYSSIQAKEMIASGYKFDVSDLIKKPIGEFLSRFFAGEGYKDGLHGFIIATLQLFSVMLVYIRVWHAEGSTPVEDKKFFPSWSQSFLDKSKEIRYWYLTTKIQKSNRKIHTFLLKLHRRLLR